MDLLLLFLLSFIGVCAGQDVLPPGPVDAIAGGNVTFTTQVGTPDYIAMVWNFGSGQHVATASSQGVKVNTKYAGRAQMDSKNGYLTLTSLVSEDSGIYTISIVLSDGTTNDGTIELRVLKPVSDAIIKSNLPEAIEHNSTVVLNCSAKGSFLKFTWTNGTTPIVADGKRLTLAQEGTSSMLTITDVFRTDLLGPIYCTAANNLQMNKSPPFNLTVYYGPDAVTISPMMTKEFIPSNANFNLSCLTTSSPNATFSWYHSQQLIEGSGQVLTLEAIKAAGLGKQKEEYTCRAQNAKTQRTVTSSGVSFSVIEVISGVKVTGPTDILIAGNSSANISCQATAGTVQTMIWLKDGTALAPSSHRVFSNNQSSLLISPLSREDGGEYTCQLINPVSSGKASYTMVVNYGPEAVKVKIDRDVPEKHDVTLTCLVLSFPPAALTWKFNGTVTGTTTDKYVIKGAADTKSGTYTCEAYNAVTGKTTSENTTVSVKPEVDNGLSDGAIAGIVIAVIVAMCVAIGLILYCRQKVPVESPY
uniref:carcinoembryonic antigen-related cell adhesion molecule 5-like n=1 Tax=Monopterus albus TaxID=43700 RepID=UPI0009B36E1C|nr:carcinoembryonic antigen-related cell adhesion molecule 5-like [Monopterus albus]